MSKLLEAKAAAIEAKRTEVNGLYDQVGETEPSKDQVTQIKECNKIIEQLENEYKDLEEVELGKEANQKRLAEMQKGKRPDRTFGADEPNLREKAQSMSDVVLSDEQFKAWREGIAGKGVRTSQFGNSPAVDVKTLLTGASSTSAGALIVNDRKPILDSFYQRPLTIRDLITIGQTDSDTVEYVRVTGVTNNAAMVAEATATGDSTGTKPESAMAMAIVTEAVKILAHWIPATRNALADAGQLRTLIDEFLRYGIDEELEDQIVSGSGTGQNFTGIYNTSGIIAQAYSTDILTSLRKGRTQVRVQGRTNATAYAMNPADWETVDLLKDNENRYYFGGPQVLGNPRIWGLPVVESEAITVGLPIVADWSKAVLWDRMQTQILVSDSHSDFFIRNMIAILAEMRAAFGVIRAKAFATVDIIA